MLVEIASQGFYNRYSYRTKRHEITFGGGASSCLIDLGGGDDIARGFLWDIDLAKTNLTANFSYLYNINSRISLRTSLSFSQISIFAFLGLSLICIFFFFLPYSRLIKLKL